MKALILTILFALTLNFSFSQTKSPIKAKVTYTLTSIVYLNEEVSCSLDSGCLITFRIKKLKKCSNNTFDGFAYISKKGTANSYLSLDIRCSVTVDVANKTMLFIWVDFKGYTDKESKIVKAFQKNLNEIYSFHQQDKVIVLENSNKTNKMVINTP